MNAFEFMDRVRSAGGSVELVDGRVLIRAFPGELEIAVLNRDAIRDALLTPNLWPCRTFHSHPTTPTLPCRDCRMDWAEHPPSIRRPYERATETTTERVP